MIEQREGKLSPYTFTSGVPAIKKSTDTKEQQNRKVMNIFIIACCIPMVIGGALVFYSIPAEFGLGARLYALAPLAGCVAMHLVMHRFMGKSCHDKTNQKETK